MAGVSGRNQRQDLSLLTLSMTCPPLLWSFYYTAGISTSVSLTCTRHNINPLEAMMVSPLLFLVCSFGPFNCTLVSGALWHVQTVLQHTVISPVCCQLVGYEASRDLCDNVTPKEGAMDQAHYLRVPVKLCWLCKQREKFHGKDNTQKTSPENGFRAMFTLNSLMHFKV